jgi:hypothetical protein
MHLQWWHFMIVGKVALLYLSLSHFSFVVVE